MRDGRARGVSSKMAEGEEGGAFAGREARLLAGVAGRLRSAEWRGRGCDTDGQRPVSLGGPSRPSGYLRGMGVLVGASEGEEGTSVSF